MSPKVSRRFITVLYLFSAKCPRKSSDKWTQAKGTDRKISYQVQALPPLARDLFPVNPPLVFIDQGHLNDLRLHKHLPGFFIQGLDNGSNFSIFWRQIGDNGLAASLVNNHLAGARSVRRESLNRKLARVADVATRGGTRTDARGPRGLRAAALRRRRRAQDGLPAGTVTSRNSSLSTRREVIVAPGSQRLDRRAAEERDRLERRARRGLKAGRFTGRPQRSSPRRRAPYSGGMRGLVSLRMCPDRGALRPRSAKGFSLSRPTRRSTPRAR